LISSTRFCVSERIDSSFAAIVSHVAFLNSRCNPPFAGRKKAPVAPEQRLCGRIDQGKQIVQALPEMVAKASDHGP